MNPLSCIVCALGLTLVAGQAQSANSNTVSNRNSPLALTISPLTAPIATNDETIIKGAELKTEWTQTRNPFRFEVNEGPIYAPERVEQIQLIGFSKMPDQNGILQTYVFVTKTTEGEGSESKAGTKAPREIHTLRALPEKLDEETVTTEEQVEECSLALGGEQLWFLGVVQTNSQAMGMFLPEGAAYPIREEDLRPYPIRDSLQDLQIRVTRAGEKISTEADPKPRRAVRARAKPVPVEVPQKTATGKVN
jgi:hypothetical protein